MGVRLLACACRLGGPLPVLPPCLELLGDSVSVCHPGMRVLGLQMCNPPFERVFRGLNAACQAYSANTRQTTFLAPYLLFGKYLST